MPGPISMFVPAALLAVLALPLAFKLVPPNRFYGFRTAHTLASPRLWYRINRVASLALIAADATAVCIYLAEPELASGRSLPGVLALALPVLIALVGVGRYARKAANENS